MIGDDVDEIMATEEVRHMPPAPEKELPFAVINFYHFPTEEVAKEYEENVRKWWPETILFAGTLSGELSERYTHCIVWQYKDFDEYKRCVEDYAPTLEHSSNPVGDMPHYMFDHGYTTRVIDGRDPILLEEGVEGWVKRLHASWGTPNIQNPERVAQWRDALWTKLAADWGAEALERSGWVPSTGPTALRR